MHTPQSLINALRETSGNGDKKAAAFLTMFEICIGKINTSSYVHTMNQKKSDKSYESEVSDV